VGAGAYAIGRAALTHTYNAFASRGALRLPRPASFSFADLLSMPHVERPITMVCVSNPVGGPNVGNARWLGVPLAHLLELVGRARLSGPSGDSRRLRPCLRLQLARRHRARHLRGEEGLLGGARLFAEGARQDRVEARHPGLLCAASARPGPVTVAGSAWHPTVGIRRVQVRTDGGPWQDARLAAVESLDTWWLWRFLW
jgi:hypothetical protein